MAWQITAAISASLGLLFAFFVFAYPHLQRRRRREPLLRIDEIRKKIIDLQRPYRKVTITQKELDTFKNGLDNLRVELLDAIKQISKAEARKYEYVGFIDLTTFSGVKDPKHKEYLALCIKWVEIAEKIIDKYS